MARHGAAGTTGPSQRPGLSHPCSFQSSNPDPRYPVSSFLRNLFCWAYCQVCGTIGMWTWSVFESSYVDSSVHVLSGGVDGGGPTSIMLSPRQIELAELHQSSFNPCESPMFAKKPVLWDVLAEIFSLTAHFQGSMPSQVHCMLLQNFSRSEAPSSCQDRYERHVHTLCTFSSASRIRGI